jgi:predicted SnoaL-like aldol condensation-catalyzing enzyme
MSRKSVGLVLGAALAALVLHGAPALAGNTPQEEANKKIVLEFYDAAINQKDFDKAKQYFGARYTQHNPNAADGPEGLKAYIDFLKAKFPNAKSEFKKVFADGDYVIVHVHAVREPGTRGLAIMDIFRLEGGKVVEHWDVSQPIPEKAANTNTMF